MVMLSRTRPLTCTGIVIVVGRMASGSNLGQVDM